MVKWNHNEDQHFIYFTFSFHNTLYGSCRTVIKLSKEAGGGLWVLNPLAPTPQLLSFMKSLEDKHGPVRHIVLGTVALEHKATFGPFAGHYRTAEVWIQPGQWSFPLTIPIELSGVLQRGKFLHEIPKIPEESPQRPTDYLLDVVQRRTTIGGVL